MLIGSTLSAGGRARAQGGQQVGDGLREIADVASGLCMQRQPGNPPRARPIPPDGPSFRGNAPRAPARPQNEAQLGSRPTRCDRAMRKALRVPLNQLAVGLGCRPVRHELPRCAATAVIDKRRCIPHRAAVTALGGDQAGQVRGGRRNGEHPARASSRCCRSPSRDANRAAAVGGVRQRQAHPQPPLLLCRPTNRRWCSSGSQGLRVTYMAGFSAELQTPNSGVVVRPMRFRPA